METYHRLFTYKRRRSSTANELLESIIKNLKIFNKNRIKFFRLLFLIKTSERATLIEESKN